MNTVWIDFQLDAKAEIVNEGYEFDFATGTYTGHDRQGPPFNIKKHPKLRYRSTHIVDNGNRFGPWTALDGDQQVPVPPGSRVEITVSDTENRPEYLIVPVRFLPARWLPGDDPNALVYCTTSLLASDKSPIDIAQFSYSIPQFSYIQYSKDDLENDIRGGTWQTDPSTFTTNYQQQMGDSASVTCEVKQPQSQAQVCQPFFSFNVRNLIGVLSYSISVQILECGVLKGWGWWDPFIRVRD